MAIGYTPKYKKEFPLADLTQQQCIALGIEAAKFLGWDVFYTSGAGFKVFTKRNAFLSTNHLIKFIVVADTVSIESLSLGTEMIDFGKNKENINNLVSTIEKLRPTSRSKN